MRLNSEHFDDDQMDLAPWYLLQPQEGDMAMKKDSFKPSTLDRREGVRKDQEQEAPLGKA